jgi:hypothetical protein
MITIIDHQQRNLLYLAAGVLLLLVVTTFFSSLWQWHSDWVLIHQPAPAAQTVQADQTTAMIRSLPDAHLFGQAFSNTNGMPITNLQLRVTGIVKTNTDSGNNVSKAYISISGQPAKIYEVGDSLPYGVKVYSISDEAVILENDGHLEKLPLPREQLEFKPIETEETF